MLLPEVMKLKIDCPQLGHHENLTTNREEVSANSDTKQGMDTYSFGMFT